MPIASYVPLMMFAVLFGLSMDYQVFLLSQIAQHRAGGRGRPRRRGRAASPTARPVITAAALIMIGVFGSFVLNGDPTVKQFGVGLAVAVVLAGYDGPGAGARPCSSLMRRRHVVAAARGWRGCCPDVDIEGKAIAEAQR